jgi:uncharacterized membrane protein YbhN (UPF0104 family)
MDSSKPRVVHVAIVLALVAASAWMVHQLHWSAIATALGRATVAPLLLAVAFVLVGLWTQVARVQLLLRSYDIPFLRLARYQLASFAATNLLPARAGEALRVYLLRTNEGVPAPTTIGVFASERIAEAITLVLLALPLPWLLPALPIAMRHALVIGGVLAVVALPFLLLLRGWRPEGPAWLRAFVDGARLAVNPRVLGLSAFNWLLEAASITAVLRAFALHPPLFAPIVVLLTLNLALLVPSTPGRIGVFELGSTAGLRLVGVPTETALVVALLCHLVQFVPVTILGLAGLQLAKTAPAPTPVAEHHGSQPFAAPPVWPSSAFMP